MKFHKKEYDQFAQIIEQSRFESTDFSFVKKRGNVMISHPEISGVFIFHRKSESLELTRNQKQLSHHYEAGIAPHQIPMSDLNEVLSIFNRWIGQ